MDNSGKGRNPEKFFTDEKCEKHKREQGYISILEVPIDGIARHPFGEIQVSIDNRYQQKEEGTVLKLYKMIGPKNAKNTGKKFIIVKITPGGWTDWNNRYYNDYIMHLERIE